MNSSRKTLIWRNNILTRIKPVFFALPLIILIVIAACNNPQGPEPSQANVPQKVYANHSNEAKYVGKLACAKCHSDKYDTFIHSEMGRSFKPALKSLSVAKFEGIKPVYDRFSNLTYLPFTKGDSIYLMEFRLNGRDTTHKRIERISYIVGSGQHTNSHMIESNGYVYQAPLTWYSQEGKWDLPPGFENGHNSRFTRSIELECMTCHNAMPEFESGSDNRFMKIPDGIDCERCHGPASIHIAEKERGGHESLIDGIDYSIVNPGKLPIDLQFDLCQRCHLQGTAVTVEGKTFMDFRPGMKLSEYINVFIPRYEDSLHNFIMASHPDRLRMSACFIESQNNSQFAKPMTCITCHNPHLSIETFEADHYRKICQNCHQPDSEQFCNADQALRDSKDNNCFSCHMPKSGSSDIPHVRITDHFIRKPDKNENQLDAKSVAEQKAFFRLACRTQASPSAALMAEAYLTQYEQFEAMPWLLDSAESSLNIALQTVPESRLLRPLVRLKYLQNDFQAIQQIAQRNALSSVSDAWTAYRIGESLQQLGDPTSIDWLKSACQIAPAHLKFKNKLAAAYMRNQNIPEAMSLFNELVGRFDKDAGIFNNRGFAFVLSDNFEAAEKDFKKALMLDPDSEIAMANLASLYLNTNRSDLAKKFTAELLRRNPENPDYLKLKSILGI